MDKEKNDKKDQICLKNLPLNPLINVVMMLIIYNTTNLEEKSSNPIQNMDQENQQYE